LSILYENGLLELRRTPRRIDRSSAVALAVEGDASLVVVEAEGDSGGMN
jgi:hypothetical protein